MCTAKSRIIDILLMILYMLLFLISTESIENKCLSLIAAIVALSIFMIDILYSNGKIYVEFTFMHMWMIVFICFCYISSIWALQSDLAVIKGNSIVKNCICIILIYFHCHKTQNIRHLLKIIMYGGYAVIMLSIGFWGVDFLYSIITSSNRLPSSFLNQNKLGMLVAFTLLINVYFVAYYKQEMKVIPLAIISLFVLAAAGSRKSVIELILGTLILCAIKNYNGRKRLKSFIKIIGRMIVLVVIFVILSMLPVFDFVNTRLENVWHQITGEGYTDFSVRSRSQLNSIGWKLFKENPILGIGIDCARIPVTDITGRDWYLHNNYIELLADGGIIGCFLYYFIFGVMLLRFLRYCRYRDAEFDLCLTLMLVHLVLNLAYVSYYGRETYFYIMLFFLETEILRKKYMCSRRLTKVKCDRYSCVKVSL